MAGSVRCEVNTCTHWLQSGQCGANSIDILSGDGGQPGTSAGTACNTFYRRRGLANYLSSLQNLSWWGVMDVEDEATSPSIACRVNNCRYWAPGDLCQADQVTVAGGGAAASDETACRTFTP